MQPTAVPFRFVRPTFASSRCSNGSSTSWTLTATTTSVTRTRVPSAPPRPPQPSNVQSVPPATRTACVRPGQGCTGGPGVVSPSLVPVCSVLVLTSFPSSPSLLSKLVFGWLDSFLGVGFTRPLQKDGAPQESCLTPSPNIDRADAPTQTFGNFPQKDRQILSVMR